MTITQGATYGAITYIYSDGTVQTIYIDPCTGLPLPVQPPCTDFISADKYYFIGDETIDYDESKDYNFATDGNVPAAANKAELQFQYYDQLNSVPQWNVTGLSTGDASSPSVGNGAIHPNLSGWTLQKEEFTDFRWKSGSVLPPITFNHLYIKYYI